MKFLQFLGGFCLFVVSFFARLAILCRIWNLVTASFSLPHLTMLQMFGVTLFLSAATFTVQPNREMDAIRYVRDTLTAIVSLLFAWGIAHLVFA